MGAIKEYQQLTLIETYDWEVRTTPVKLEVIQKLLQDNQFLQLENELINRANIKRVVAREVSDVDKILYSIEDKNIRKSIMIEIASRQAQWLRVNATIVQNLLSKYQEDVDR